MSKAIELQSPDLRAVLLVLNSVDAEGNPVTITYKLCYEYRAIKRAEDAVGIDLLDFTQWGKLKSSQTPELIHAGLAKFHPEVTLDQLLDLLSPEIQAAAQDAIFELLFPGVLDRIKKLKEEQASTEGASPNVETEPTVAA